MSRDAISNLYSIMDTPIQQTIAAEVIRRRRAIIIAAVVTASKRRRVLEQRKRRLWSREWLLRRDTGQNVLNMVFGKLGSEDPASFTNYTLPISRPSTSTQSGSSTSEVCTSRRRKKKNPRSDDSDEFSSVITKLTNSINTPITVNMSTTNSTSDSVDGFLSFIGSLLRNFQDEELKLEVMNQVTQLIINARVTDYQRKKKYQVNRKYA